ncbi:uncharacterized protein LOC141704906 [Apium graveolens]|uniref:uncharacterized protein LOC141704906 n=1 Tax=Apium graveolens TaxID=4045 RepID=UPI003D7A3CA7
MWGEAVRHSIYVLNGLPTRVLEGKTPYEAWSGRMPDLSHLSVFGCCVYMKIPTVNVKKLDDRSRRMIYLGREPGTKGNRLYDPMTGSMHKSRDVVFFEDEFWSWEKAETTEILIPGQVLEVEETPVVEHRDTAEQEERTPVQIPRDTTEGEFTKNTDISSAESSEPRRYRPLHEIYNETEMIEMIDEVMLLKVEEPTHYSEAVSEQEWVEAMKTEVEMSEKNNT